MALAVDGFHVLRAMADHAALFADVRAEANKQATALFSKQIKKASLENVRAIYQAIGKNDFRKMVDVLTGLAPLVKRLDKFNPELKTMSAQQQRELFLALADSSATPTEKPVKAAEPKKAKASKSAPKEKKEKGIMDLKSMQVRDREKE